VKGIDSGRYVTALCRPLPWLIFGEHVLLNPQLLLIEDTAPSHNSGFTKQVRESEAIAKGKWSPTSPDLNSIAHVWRLMKWRILRHHGAEWITTSREMETVLVLCTSRAGSSSGCPWVQGGLESRVTMSPGWARVQGGLESSELEPGGSLGSSRLDSLGIRPERGSTNGLDSLRSSSRLEQGSTSELDFLGSRLEQGSTSRLKSLGAHVTYPSNHGNLQLPQRDASCSTSAYLLLQRSCILPRHWWLSYLIPTTRPRPPTSLPPISPPPSPLSPGYLFRPPMPQAKL